MAPLRLFRAIWSGIKNNSWIQTEPYTHVSKQWRHSTVIWSVLRECVEDLSAMHQQNLGDLHRHNHVDIWLFAIYKKKGFKNAVSTTSDKPYADYGKLNCNVSTITLYSCRSVQDQLYGYVVQIDHHIIINLLSGLCNQRQQCY